jgi:polysaccharide export outer membrane protein
MINKLLFLTILFALFFTSCIPRKDIIYLQNKSKSETINQVVQIESRPYRIQTGDILTISLKALDQKLVEMFSISQNASSSVSQGESSSYFSGYSVDIHGEIRIPVIGSFNVLGMTVDEIRLKIENLLLADYYNKEAEIFVTVRLSGFRYTISGEVGSSGSKILFRDKVSIMEAIANSGDILITGDRKDIVIMRQFPQGTEMYSIDLTDINAVKSPYYFLQPNDFIYVKPLKQKTWGTGTIGLQTFTTITSVFATLIATFFIFQRF